MPFIERNKLRVEYSIHGKGCQPVVFFHGFGRNAQDGTFFEPLLLQSDATEEDKEERAPETLAHKRHEKSVHQHRVKSSQCLISINLFAHGASYFPEERIDGQPLLKDEWQEIFKELMLPFGKTRAKLVGYSMGARVAMITAQLLPEKVESLLLLAPDGFKINKVYKFASGSSIGKKMYRSLIENPLALFSIAKGLNKTGLLSDKLHRFVQVHLDSREKRIQVHDAWLIYKHFFPDKDRLARLINTGAFQFAMIFGKYDSVIKPELGERFVKKLKNKSALHLVESGHRLLEEKTLRYIQENKLW